MIPASHGPLGLQQQPVDLALAAWLDAKANRTGSARTARTYRALIASFRGLLRERGLDLDANPGHGDPAPATHNQRLAVLSSFYTDARRRGLLAIENPIERVARRPVQGYAGARALPYLAVRARLAAIDRGTLAGKRDYALLAVALQTGRRVSELAGARAGDMSLSGDVLTVTWRRCKGGKTLVDSLPPAVGDVVREYLAAMYGDGWAALPDETPVWVSFARNRSRGRALGIQSIADICARRLGTSKVHALRHTFARAMEDAGAKVSEIQARLGHESLATTGRYLAALRSGENPHATRVAALFGIDDAH
jgi:integrase